MIRALLGPYIVPAALVGALAVVGLLAVQSMRIDALQAENALLTLRAEGAEARVDTLKQAMERRNDVEALSDDDLRDELSRRVRSGN